MRRWRRCWGAGGATSRRCWTRWAPASTAGARRPPSAPRGGPKPSRQPPPARGWGWGTAPPYPRSTPSCAPRGPHLPFSPPREPVHSQVLALGTVNAELGTPTFSLPYGQLNHLYLRGYVPELEAFARHVREGEPPEASISQAYTTLRVGQA